MEAIARLAARRPVAVCAVAAALVVLGWTAWRGLPLDLLPDLQSPTILVSIRSGDRPPTEMERIYGEEVEQPDHHPSLPGVLGLAMSPREQSDVDLADRGVLGLGPGAALLEAEAADCLER